MPLGSVIIHDLDNLEEFEAFLLEEKDELEKIYQAISRSCDEQHDNWQDPQYDEMKDGLDEFVADSTALLQDLEDAASNIAYLIDKLRTP